MVEGFTQAVLVSHCGALDDSNDGCVYGRYISKWLVQASVQFSSISYSVGAAFDSAAMSAGISGDCQPTARLTSRGAASSNRKTFHNSENEV